MSKTPSEIALAAYSYAASGQHVIPLEGVRGDGTCTCGSLRCGSPGKHPVAALAPNGKNNASNDPATVASWEGQMVNIGLRTDGLLVIDVDGKPGRDSYRRLVDEVGPLPATRWQTTGKGWHLLYRIPTGSEISQSTRPLGDPPGIDLRVDDRGYIVVAPSTHPSGAVYDWRDAGAAIADLPQAWLDKLTPKPREERVVEPVQLGAEVHGTPWGLAVLRGEADRVRAALEGTRNSTLNAAAFAVGQAVGSGHVNEEPAYDTLITAALEIELTNGEASNTIVRALAKGIDSPRGPFVDEDADDPGGPEPMQGVHGIPARRLFENVKAMPDIPILVGEKGQVLLGRNEMLLMAASPGAGKTTLTLDAIAHLAAGQEWLGWPASKPLKFLIIENEGSMQSFADKLEAKHRAWIAAGRGSFIDNVIVWPGDPEHGWGQVSLMDERTLAVLKLDIERYAIDIVVCDSIASMAAEGHGAAPEVEAMVKRLKSTGGAFWMLHHNNKTSHHDTESPEKISGTWARPADAVLSIASGGEYKTKLFYTKLRNATPDGAWHFLSWEVETQGYVETSAVAPVTEDDIRKRILDAMQDLPPGVSSNVLKSAVTGNKSMIGDTIKSMVENGELVNEGTGQAMELHLPDALDDLPF